MAGPEVQRITLESLSEGIPAILAPDAFFYIHKCMVCFHKVGHRSGVVMTVVHEGKNSDFEIAWTGDITEQLIKAHQDEKQATEFGALAIAVILVRELTEYTAVEQSIIGTTTDYYLGRQGVDEDLIFNRVARLEVSGILRETDQNTVQDRIKQKTRRLKHERDLPDFIVVVEFSRPWTKMVLA